MESKIMTKRAMLDVIERIYNSMEDGDYSYVRNLKASAAEFQEKTNDGGELDNWSKREYEFTKAQLDAWDKVKTALDKLI